MRILLPILMVMGFASCSSVTTKDVDYKVGDKSYRGYMALTGDEDNKKPGVVVVHEWWGHNDYARKRADQLAALGYNAIALDMYGDGKTANHPKDAMKFSSEAFKNPTLLKAKFNKAVELLKEQPSVDADRIGAIGYCFGGAVVLFNATQGADLKGVVSFHGSLSGIKKVTKNSRAKLLVINGADDPLVTKDDISNFKKVIRRSQLPMRFVNLPGATHAFTNPKATENGKKFNLPLAYNEKADKESWDLMREFLQNTL
ncbi:dienelactone hydrolase family protein [Halobacteriovorax sp. ZH4_bin.1]|uniref:dienelactone hydrolase family protein n=1 Tax=unclassified Halobacteriovorax TaxID=2639665 RepID=UPI0037202B23